MSERIVLALTVAPHEVIREPPDWCGYLVVSSLINEGYKLPSRDQCRSLNSLYTHSLKEFLWIHPIFAVSTKGAVKVKVKVAYHVLRPRQAPVLPLSGSLGRATYC